MEEKEILQIFVRSFVDINSHILLDHELKDACFSSFSDDMKPFGLDHEGYYNIYSNLFGFIKNLDDIGGRLSDDFVHEKLHSLLGNFANKRFNTINISFEEEAVNFYKEINRDFEIYQCFIPIIGLSIDEPMIIGDVNFLNIEDSQKIVKGETFSFFKDLSSHKDAVAICQVQAEWKRATEISREKTDYVLNFFRFIGSLVWYNQPSRHVYIKGKDKSRFSYSLAIDQQGRVSRCVNSEFFILPYKIDSEFLSHALFYGFKYYQSLFENRDLDPIQKSLLVAIQWYGDATQDLNQLNSYIKFYMSIEILLKKENERAKTVIPRRLSTLLNLYNKTNQQKMEKEIIDLIDERNSIFHTGVPIREKPDYLQYTGKVLGRSVIHHIRLIIQSEGITTKEGLFESLENHYNKYLQ